MRKLDPGDGRRVQARVVIKLWTDGAMSVEGDLSDPLFMLAILDNAKDAVRRNGRPRNEIVVPNQDVSTPDPQHPLVTLD